MASMAILRNDVSLGQVVVMMRYTTIESPVGPVLIAGDEAGIRHISFVSGTDPLAIPRPSEGGWVRDEEAFPDARAQVNEYFAGNLREFHLRLAPQGTEFQRQVWNALQAVGYGRTVHYGELAAQIGRPKAARAVGAAAGRNPLPIVVPCHRMIGINGSLTGYRGGTEIKRFLLALETRNNYP